MKRAVKFISAVIILVLVLCSCSKSATTQSTTSEETDTTTLKVSDIIDEDDMFSKRDLNPSYDESEAVKIKLKDNKSSCDSDSVTINDNTITITDEGVYIVSGTLTNGQIQIDTDKENKVQLVLDGVDINCDTSASIYVVSADKVFVTLADDSKNILANKNDFVAIDDNNINAVLYAKDDLTINGSGSLTVNANYGHGISCKDDLVVTGGKINVTSAKHCLDANDSVRVTTASLTLKATKDAIHCDNDDDETKGFVYIKDGTFNINCDDDGIHSSSALKIAGGSINISNSYEGIEGKMIELAGGTIDIISSDDGLNASSGSNSGANENASGDFQKPDDSNADGDSQSQPEKPDDTKFSNSQADDTQQSQPNDKKDFGNGQMGGGDGGALDSDSSCYLEICGATLTVNAEGDGLDSNGSLIMSSGNVVVYGPANDGNGALDYGTTATITGGTIIAIGQSGMAQNFGDTSSQGSILYNSSNNHQKDENISIADDNGNVLISATSVKKYNSVVFSSPDIKSDGKYTVTMGDETQQIEMSGVTYSNSQGMGNGNGDQGGKIGDEMPSGEAPSGDMPSGEMPSGEKPSGEIPSGDKPDQQPSFSEGQTNLTSST
jgi:hypothetical protein